MSGGWPSATRRVSQLEVGEDVWEKMLCVCEESRAIACTYERGVAFCEKTGEPVGDGGVVLRNESSSIALQWNGKNCRPTAQPPPCPGMHRTAGFPPELLLCDPENVTYSALDFKKGVRETFFSYDVSVWRHGLEFAWCGGARQAIGGLGL